MATFSIGNLLLLTGARRENLEFQHNKLQTSFGNRLMGCMSCIWCCFSFHSGKKSSKTFLFLFAEFLVNRGQQLARRYGNESSKLCWKSHYNHVKFIHDLDNDCSLESHYVGGWAKERDIPTLDDAIKTELNHRFFHL